MRWQLAARLAVASVAYLAVLFPIEWIADDGNWVAGLGVAISVAFGVVVGQWWVLGVPAVLIVIILVSTAVFGVDEEMSFVGEVGVAAAEVFLGAAALAFGVTIRRAVARGLSVRRPQPGDTPAHT